MRTSYLLTASWIQSGGLDDVLAIHIVGERARSFIIHGDPSSLYPNHSLGRTESPRLEYPAERRQIESVAQTRRSPVEEARDATTVVSE